MYKVRVELTAGKVAVGEGGSNLPENLTGKGPPRELI